MSYKGERKKDSDKYVETREIGRRNTRTKREKQLRRQRERERRRIGKIYARAGNHEQKIQRERNNKSRAKKMMKRVAREVCKRQDRTSKVKGRNEQ